MNDGASRSVAILRHIVCGCSWALSPEAGEGQLNVNVIVHRALFDVAVRLRRSSSIVWHSTSSFIKTPFLIKYSGTSGSSVIRWYTCVKIHHPLVFCASEMFRESLREAWRVPLCASVCRGSSEKDSQTWM